MNTLRLLLRRLGCRGNGMGMHELAEAIDRLTCWLDKHQECATQRDLRHAEERIVAAIDGAISCEDVKLLDALGARSKALTKKLERLDDKTPPI